MKKAGEHDIDRMVYRTTNAIQNFIITHKLRGQVLHVRSGGLIGGFKIKGRNGRYRLKNRMVYAAIHEFGGDINYTSKRGKRVHIHMPVRSYIRSTIDEKWNAIMKLASQYLWQEINRGK